MDNDCSHEIKTHLFLGGKAMTNLDSILKSRDITLPTKVQTVKVIVFSLVIYGWIWELDHKEYWAPKNWCFITVMLKILESPLDCKEIKPVNPKENQPWILIERTDPEASILPSIRVFSNESALCIRWPKDWSFSISLSSEYSGLIFFRIDWSDLLAVQGTHKSLLQHHNLKASVL